MTNVPLDIFCTLLYCIKSGGGESFMVWDKGEYVDLEYTHTHKIIPWKGSISNKLREFVNPGLIYFFMFGFWWRYRMGWCSWPSGWSFGRCWTGGGRDRIGFGGSSSDFGWQWTSSHPVGGFFIHISRQFLSKLTRFSPHLLASSKGNFSFIGSLNSWTHNR